jgi:hypothetical protein
VVISRSEAPSADPWQASLIDRFDRSSSSSGGRPGQQTGAAALNPAPRAGCCYCAPHHVWDKRIWVCTSSSWQVRMQFSQYTPLCRRPLHSSRHTHTHTHHRTNNNNNTSHGLLRRRLGAAIGRADPAAPPALLPALGPEQGACVRACVCQRGGWPLCVRMMRSIDRFAEHNHERASSPNTLTHTHLPSPFTARGGRWWGSCGWCPSTRSTRG